MQTNDLTYIIIGCVYAVHKNLGPGLLESTYEKCLEYELLKAGLSVQTQVLLPIQYEEIQIDAAYRLDILVESKIILELKAVKKIEPIHKAQLITYLKLADLPLGLLLNFNVGNMQSGITRIAI